MPTRGFPLYSSPLLTSDGRLLPSHGEHVCDWIESRCVYGEGDWFGEPVVLRDFQRRFIYRLYEYYPETGLHRYKRAIFGVAKGNGKTPAGAWVAAHELACDQCTNAPRVIVGAASFAQADLVFGDLRTSCRSEALEDVVVPYDTEIHLRDRPGVAQRIAAVAGTNDGKRGTCFIADELHEWTGRKKRVFMVTEGAIAKRRNAFTLAISTAGVDDDEEILKQLYSYGRRLHDGDLVDDATLFEWFEAPLGLDLDDRKQLLAAIYAANPAAGDFNPIEGILSRFDGAQRMPRHEFERYHLNRWLSAENVWEVAQLWPALANERLALDPALPLFVAIDLGYQHDSTAIIGGQRQGDRVIVVPIRIIENPYPLSDARHKGWKVNFAEIQNELISLRACFPLRAREKPGPAFFYDKYMFESTAQELGGEGLNMIDFPQTDPRMGPASQNLFQVVVEGRLTHNGDPVLARHMRGVVAKVIRRGGWRIDRPDGAKQKIDGAVATAMAVFEATRVAPKNASQMFVFSPTDLGLE